MEEKQQSTRVFLWPVAGLAVAVLLALEAPVLHKQRRLAEREEKVDQIKWFHLELLSFDKSFGSFPSDDLMKDEPRFAGLAGA